jgi:cellulose synthase/poly-beta-1,6-N-acetylglucosamine synthase-like glycosyltransferase
MTTRSYHRIPEDILALSHERDLLRRKGQYDRADLLKERIESAGYAIKDNPHGAHLIILPGVNVDGHSYRTSRELPSLLSENDLYTFSIQLLVQEETTQQAQSLIESILHFPQQHSYELFILDNASNNGFDLWAEALRQRESHVHLLHTTRKMGDAEAYNMGMKQSRGRFILILDAQSQVNGDILGPLANSLSDEHVGLTGPRGLRSDDLRHFEMSEENEVEAIELSCMAFKRELLTKTGLFDEGYRNPYFMDIDFSFALRDYGVQAVRTPDMPLVQAEAARTTSEREYARVQRRNFYRFLQKWGSREDMLLDSEYDEEDEEDEEDEQE